MVFGVLNVLKRRYFTAFQVLLWVIINVSFPLIKDQLAGHLSPRVYLCDVFFLTTLYLLDTMNCNSIRLSTLTSNQKLHETMLTKNQL